MPGNAYSIGGPMKKLCKADELQLIIPQETITLYESLAAEYLQELYEEYFDAAEIDSEKLDIKITVKTDIGLKE